MRNFGLVIFLLLPMLLSSQVVERKVLDSLLSSGALLLDVRTTEDFEKGSVNGALHLPLKDIETFAKFHPIDQPVVVFCNTGRQSSQAVEKLRAMGGKNIFDGRDIERISRSLNNLYFKSPNKATTLWNDSGSSHHRLFLSRDETFHFATAGQRILYVLMGEIELSSSKKSLYTEGDQIVLPSQQPATLRALSPRTVVLIIEKTENAIEN